MASILEWLRTASLGEIGGAVFLIYYGLKALARFTPSEADDNFLAQVGAALNWISRALRFDPPKNPIEIPPEALDRLKTATDNIEALASLGPAGVTGPDPHPFLRRFLRATARLNGVDLTEISDEDLDVVIGRARAKAGPVRDFFAWVMAHPEVLLALLKVFMGEAKPVEGGQVS